MDWAGIDFDPSDFGGETNPLQRISLTLPPNHGMVAFTFVLRSADGACVGGGSMAGVEACAAA